MIEISYFWLVVILAVGCIASYCHGLADGRDDARKVPLHDDELCPPECPLKARG